MYQNSDCTGLVSSMNHADVLSMLAKARRRHRSEIRSAPRSRNASRRVLARRFFIRTWSFDTDVDSFAFHFGIASPLQ